MGRNSMGRNWLIAGVKRVILLLACHLVAGVALAQQDSLILRNGNTIVGEIKSLENRALIMGTDYSKSDFSIKWDAIKEIFSKNRFLITMIDGRRMNGSFQSTGDGTKIRIETVEGQQVETSFEEIVSLTGFKADFWSRASASIDLGMSLTKANNLRQFAVRSDLGYLADRWQLNFFYDDLLSDRDDVEQTRRTEWGPSFKYFLKKDWFLNTSLNFLSNTEQAIDFRTTAKVGAGKDLIRTNKTVLGLGAGVSYNNESFTNDAESRSSMEGYLGLEANLLERENFSLTSSFFVYPSFTESGRWRSDLSLDTRYDLPLNLYTKIGGTLNYDNQPAVAGSETDYVLMFSVGWGL